MKKYIRYFFIIAVIISFASASLIFNKNKNREYRPLNPVDKGGENYQGFESTDADGDGLPDFTLSITKTSITAFTLKIDGVNENLADKAAYRIDSDPGESDYFKFSDTFTVDHGLYVDDHTVHVKVLFKDGRESPVVQAPFSTTDLPDSDGDNVPDFTCSIEVLSFSNVRLSINGVTSDIASRIAADVDSNPLDSDYVAFSTTVDVAHSSNAFGDHTLEVKIKMKSGIVSIVKSFPFTHEDIFFVSTTGSDSNSGVRTYPFKTIQTAVEKAQQINIHKVYIGEGTYTKGNGLLAGINEGLFITNNNITIIGGWNADFSVKTGYSELDAEDVFRAICVSNVTNVWAEGFGIVNGSIPSGNGGGIYMNGSSDCVLTNIRIYTNEAQYGGGIYIVSVTNTSLYADVFGNISVNNIGNIYIDNSADISVNGGVYSNTGSGVHINNCSSIQVNASVYMHNRQGIKVLNSIGTTVSGDVYKNDAAATAGGIHFFMSVNNVITGNVYENTAGEFGGGDIRSVLHKYYDQRVCIQ
ncbi:hypothetical protein ACFL6D_03700 [Spirochaetota bacterium]